MGMFSTFLGGLFGLGQVGLQNAANAQLVQQNLEYQKERNKEVTSVQRVAFYLRKPDFL